MWTVQHDLTGLEREVLADVPPMTQEALVLLSGLTPRIGRSDPRRRWALGNWFADPLRRTLAWSRAGRVCGVTGTGGN
ncbi:hypothetical protein OG864_02770 [Streptomyces sp. NBC_00124]|uniref:hypothetical protein n=1 Tax=Streptomyces sp. NBC_00124 TaxID=2975662 RepID=UPI00225A1181|nr:hypothetical protein [Streptomyces sp. NBC_00124]MCX5357662.1 hypothetical protein [Streptomyces sp. NBC_00124]